MSKVQNRKGFTIIEVVLVLAIAGLIFMMVFLALPALQRSQRDTQRKNDLSRAITAITNYSAANRGLIPLVAADFTTLTTSYLANATNGDSFIDPAGINTSQAATTTTYLFATPTTGAQAALTAGFLPASTQNVIYPTTGAICSSTSPGATVVGGSRKIALRMYLEGGGVYCLNN